MARRLLNPYVALALDALFVTAAELLLKIGATGGASLPRWISWLGFGALASPWTWLGIIANLMGFACWLYVLRYVPVSIAFGLLGIAQVFVPLGAWMFLGEAISPLRWFGIALVLLGTICLARMLMTMGVEL